MDKRTTTAAENGIAQSMIWNCDDIRLGHAVSRFSDFVRNSASSQHKDVVRLHFGLKGNYSFYYKQLDRTFDLIGGHHNIMYSKDFDMVVENRTLELETFGIQFPRETFIRFTSQGSDTLKRFAEPIIHQKPVILSENWGAIDSPIQQVIQQIIHNQYSGEWQKVFLLSKSIELLVLAADAYQLSASRTETFIKRRSDKEKIIAVRDLINERVSNPPNLSEISRMVGLNEYKLKKGFKEIFNNTVFGYLSEQRLHLAHRYLLDTSKSAAEISAELGYSTPQHFNNAFLKKFGATPIAIRNGVDR